MSAVNPQALPHEPEPLAEPRRWTGGFGYALFLVFAAAAFCIRYVFFVRSYDDVPKYVDGMERMPFQGRILTGWIVRALVHAPGLGHVFNHTVKTLPQYSRGPDFMALALVDMVAMVLAVLAVRAILLRYTGDRGFASWASLLVIYMSYFNLVIGFGLSSQPYDVVALAFMAAGVWLALSDRYWWLALLVFFSSFNRETTIFLPFFVLLCWWFRRDAAGRRAAFAPVAGHVVLETALCVSVRAWIGHLLRNSPDTDANVHGLLSLHIKGNLKDLVEPQFWPLFLSLFGFSLVLFVADYKLIADRALARATVVVMIAWFCIMAVVGVLVEVRIYGELTAFLAPCIGLILWARWNGRRNGRSPHSQIA